MIRYFCDCCSEEIAANDIKDRNPLHRLTAKLKRGNSELQVEVLETKDNVSNAGDFCRYCVLDALYGLDDRPKQAVDLKPLTLDQAHKIAKECGIQLGRPLPKSLLDLVRD